MKSKGIIYPNTSFFRKYAGKLRMPAGVEEEGGVAIELVPVEVVELFELSGNPYFEESSGEASAIFILVGEEVTGLSFTIDELTATIPPDDEDVIQVEGSQITQEQLDFFHDVGVDYFDDKIGQYITQIYIVISHMEGYTPLAVGEHPYELTVNGAAVSVGEFILV